MFILKKKFTVLSTILIILMLTIGCSEESKTKETNTTEIETSDENDEVDESETKVENIDEVEEEEQEPEITQKELEEIKKDAVRADFVEIKENEDSDGMLVYAKGEISTVDYDRVMDVMPSFLLYPEEGGVYHITNVLGYEGLEDGDIVTIYGVVLGTTDAGIPKIITRIIEPE